MVVSLNIVGLRDTAFDVGLAHWLVAQGEAKSRHVETGRVINCLMLGSNFSACPS